MKKIITFTVLNLFMATSFCQISSRLDSALNRDFSTKPLNSDMLVYTNSKNVKKIDKPLVNNLIPNFSFYQVRFIHFSDLGHSFPTCLILFDSITSKTLVAFPMGYPKSERFLKLFIGKKFSDSASLLNFIYELQELMLIYTSVCTYENIKYNNNSVTFDLVYNDGKKKELWRKFEIIIDNDTIKSFISKDPKNNSTFVVE